MLLFFHLFPLCLRVHRVVARRLALLQYGSDVSFLVSDTPHQGHLHCAEARLFLLPPSHVGNYVAHGLVLDRLTYAIPPCMPPCIVCVVVLYGDKYHLSPAHQVSPAQQEVGRSSVQVQRKATDRHSCYSSLVQVAQAACSYSCSTSRVLR